MSSFRVTSWGGDQATLRTVAHPGGNSLLPPWGLCPAVPSDGAPREPLVVVVGVKIRTLGGAVAVFLPLLAPAAVLSARGPTHSRGKVK